MGKSKSIHIGILQECMTIIEYANLACRQRHHDRAVTSIPKVAILRDNAVISIFKLDGTELGNNKDLNIYTIFPQDRQMLG